MAAPHFINVDLEIESRHDLAVLESELGKNMCVLFGGQARCNTGESFIFGKKWTG
jgi:hypothetical protein